MRIGEISMNINTRACNYGSILHSWAFQQYLKKYEGIESVETINYIRKDLEKWNRQFPAFEWIKKRNPRKLITHLIGFYSYRKRLAKVDRFIARNMSISKKRYFQSDLQTGTLDYDVLVADSDTIWAPRGNGSFDKGYFLNLPAMERIKRISYAPSMGNAEINEKQKKEIAKLIEPFSHISCRETYERELLVECTGRDIAKVLDPVLLLPQEDWEELINREYNRAQYQNYVLIYQPVDESEALEKCACQYAEKFGLSIIKISIADIVKDGKKDITVLNKCSPEEFLYLARNAHVIFTNSFHMICFSIIFKREFYAFSRKDDRKVEDICKIIGLGDRFYKTSSDYVEAKIDFNSVMKLLEPQIEESRRWLHNAIYS